MLEVDANFIPVNLNSATTFSAHEWGNVPHFIPAKAFYGVVPTFSTAMSTGALVGFHYPATSSQLQVTPPLL